MQIEQNDVKTLTYWGLTERQVKVYLALLRIGASKAEAVSKASMVHRQEIYRVMNRLQELGLVEIKINRPTIFSAIPLKEALKILIDGKKDEFIQILEKTETLAAKLGQCRLDESLIDKPYFGIISGNACLRKMKHALESSCRNIEIVSNFKRLSQGFSAHEFFLLKALRRGVEIKIIAGSQTNTTFPNWINPSLRVFSSFQFKAIPLVSLSTSMIIYDDSIICVCIDATRDIPRGSQLWSNCRSLISLGQEYFKCLWPLSEKIVTN